MSDLKQLFTQAAEAAAHYRDQVAEAPELPRLAYKALVERMSAPVPESGSAPDAVLRELLALTEGGLMPIVGPRFFGWVNGASHPAGVAADIMVAAWGQNAGFHTATPAASAMEAVAERWLLDLLDLPEESGIGFATGATVANATCLAAARTHVLGKVGWDADADGLFGAPPVHVLIGAEAHSSLFASLQLIGFGARRVIKVDVDGEGRIIPAALERAIAGLDGPKVIIAQAGHINSGAFDPFTDIAAIARAHDAWLHVDGAFGLWARASANAAERALTNGIEHCDSWCTDGHKWLQVPYDCGFAIVRHKATLEKAMTQWASYLPQIGNGDRVPSAYVPELSRRARGVPVWAVIKALGRDGIAEMVARHCRLARRLGERLAAEPGIEVLNQVVINQVSVSFGSDEATRAVIARIQEDGVLYAGGSHWRGRWVMRLSVTSGPTADADIEITADAIIAAARAVKALV
jgi:glutamate/tyrosine decarboxylase-like PLP-dependent enzyme